MTNLRTYNKLSSLMDEGRAVNVVFLEFSRAFDPVFCKIQAVAVRAESVVG